MSKIAIVGHGADKFDLRTSIEAHDIIRDLANGASLIISGHSPMGGVDIWAEDVANSMDVPLDIKHPAVHRWEGGYKQRNIAIAEACDEAHCIVVADYPAGYSAKRYGAPNGGPFCYHCKSDDHVKSGGCWTVLRAQDMGKPAIWHVIR